MVRAEKILKDNIELLHKLSKELLEREILDSDEIDKIIRGENFLRLKRNGTMDEEGYEFLIT
jgi:cell division protease FtsH